MNKIFKKIFIAVVLCSRVATALPVFAQDDLKGSLQNFGKAAYGESGAQYAEEQGPIVIAGRIVNAVLGVVGLIVVILIIYAGFMWMTAGGNEQRIEKAKGILTNAIIGLIIIILAYAISYFVINQLLRASGAPVTP